MRYFIEFSYNGSTFFGYRIQPNEISVQEELEKALSTILRTGIKTTGAGRTDTGVPVSYTHLDVYKRQILFCSQKRKILLDDDKD